MHRLKCTPVHSSEAMYTRFKKAKGKTRDGTASWYVSLAQSGRRSATGQSGEKILAYLGNLNPKVPLDGQLTQLAGALVTALESMAIRGTAAEQLQAQLVQRARSRHTQGRAAVESVPLEPIPPSVQAILEKARRAGVPEASIQARIRYFRQRRRLPWQKSLGL